MKTLILLLGLICMVSCDKDPLVIDITKTVAVSDCHNPVYKANGVDFDSEWLRFVKDVFEGDLYAQYIEEHTGDLLIEVQYGQEITKIRNQVIADNTVITNPINWFEWNYIDMGSDSLIQWYYGNKHCLKDNYDW